jgi:flagellar biosynthesis component FlhA
MSTIAEVAARFAKLDLMKEAQIAIKATEGK